MEVTIEELTATRRNKTNVDANKCAEPSGRYQVPLGRTLAFTNRLPRRSTAEEQLSSLFLPLGFSLLLSLLRCHFPAKFSEFKLAKSPQEPEPLTASFQKLITDG